MFWEEFFVAEGGTLTRTVLDAGEVLAIEVFETVILAIVFEVLVLVLVLAAVVVLMALLALLVLALVVIVMVLVGVRETDVCGGELTVISVEVIVVGELLRVLLARLLGRVVVVELFGSEVLAMGTLRALPMLEV